MASLANFMIWMIIIIFALVFIGIFLKAREDTAKEEEQKKEERLVKAQEYGRGRVFKAKR
jgi:uncharacterized membrane protein